MRKKMHHDKMTKVLFLVPYIQIYTLNKSENHVQKIKKKYKQVCNVKIFHIKTCRFILIHARMCQNNTTIS